MPRSLTIEHLPLHVYDLLATPPPPSPGSAAQQRYEALMGAAQADGGRDVEALSASPGVFVTANVECARAFPLQMADVRPRRPQLASLAEVNVDDIPM
jgi:hypothetical protein